MQFNKNQLDQLGTIFGAIAGIATVLTTQGVIDSKVGGSISGIATVLLGIVIQRPATAQPTTEQVEDQEIKS